MTAIDNLKKRWLTEDEGKINAAIVALLPLEQGKKLLWWLLQIGGVGHQPFAGNSLTTAFNCGVLDVGQQILARIVEISPEGYINMVKENANERARRDQELGKAGDADRDSSDRGGDGSWEPDRNSEGS